MSDLASPVLVLGGARSGKSLYAESLVLNSGLEPVYIATAEGCDQEMRNRIEAHAARRDGIWCTVDAPTDLEDAVQNEAALDRALLIDCVTIWLSNLLIAGAECEERVDRFCGSLKALPGLIVIVSNEVGMGVVPDNTLGRTFRDLQGQTNQKLAADCKTVIFVTAGLPLALKGKLPK